MYKYNQGYQNNYAAMANPDIGNASAFWGLAVTMGGRASRDNSATNTTSGDWSWDNTMSGFAEGALSSLQGLIGLGSLGQFDPYGDMQMEAWNQAFLANLKAKSPELYDQLQGEIEKDFKDVPASADGSKTKQMMDIIAGFVRRKEEEEYQAVRDAHFKQMEKHVAGLEKPPAPVRRPGPAQLTLIKPLIPRLGGPGFLPNTELGYHIEGLTERASESDVKMNFSYQCSIIMADFHAVSEAMDAYWQSVDEQLKQEAIMNPRSRFSMGVDHDRIDREEYRRLVNQGLDPRYLLSRRPDVQFTGYGALVPEVAHAHPELVMDMNAKLGENVLTLFGFGATSKIANALGMTGRYSEFAINAASDGLFKGLGYALTEKDPTSDGFSKAVLKGAVYGIASKSLSVKLGNERQLTAALLWGGAMGAEDAANQWLTNGDGSIDYRQAATMGMIAFAGKGFSSYLKGSYSQDLKYTGLRIELQASLTKNLVFLPVSGAGKAIFLEPR